MAPAGEHTDPLEPLGDQWYAWREVGGGAAGELRVHASRHDDGRYHLDALELEGPVSASWLRSIPIGRIEAAVNARAVHGDADEARHQARIPEHLRDNAVQGYPEEFYEIVARAYRTLAATSRRPIAELASENGVPPTTAQRWVKEARRRGLLPPGRPGKAG